MVGNGTRTDPSKIGVTKVGGSSVLLPKESLTLQNCGKIQDLIEGLIKQNQTRILLDCKNASFIDSAALELLVQLHKDLEKRGGVLKLTGLSAVNRDILLATRLINVFYVYEDIAKALKSYP